MSRRNRNTGDNIDFDFFDDGPSPAPQRSESTSKSRPRTGKRASRTHSDTEASPRSSSRSDSDNEKSSSKHSVKIDATVPRVEVEDDSDSSSDSGRKTPPGPQPGCSKSKSEKTRSKRDQSSAKSSSRSRSRSASSTDSASTTDSESSDAESDMTDVSPLNSPTEKHHPRAKKQVGINETVYEMDSRPPKSGSRSRPLSGKSATSSASSSAFDRLMEADKDTLNLDLLMQAIMEMEEDRNNTHKKVVRGGIQNTNPTSLNRKNMSFTNDRVKEIDRENQRLMKNIVKNATMVKKQKKQIAKKQKPIVASHAGVNRMRDQKRIEQENYALLHRLNTAKAHPTLQREKQLDNFNNSKLYGVPMKAVHPAGDGLKSSSYSSLDRHYSTYVSRSRPSSAKSVGARPPSAKLTGSRPTSAKSDRPSSAKFTDRPISGLRKARPAWDERW